MNSLRHIFVFLGLTLFVGGGLLADEVAEGKLQFAGFPGISYTSDGGFGFGIIGSMYERERENEPYRFALDAQIFFSTEGQQSHYLKSDWLDAFGLPMRLLSQFWYVLTSNQTYCGKGASADCNETLAPNDNYYLVRYSEILGRLELRWNLNTLPHKVDIVAAWRGSYYQPGTWSESTPYPDSLFALTFEGGEKGFASVFEFGMMFDNRDQEASPTSGYWIEASLRQSSPSFGSNWQYFGLNVSARGYIPFDQDGRFVLASQLILDTLFGDAPLAEIARVGNSQGFIAFGGANIGRGLREQYFPGRLKLIEQIELRYRFADFGFWSQRFNLTALTFTDVGMIGWRVEDLDKEPKKTIAGFGSGLRLAWNTDFVVRFDMGLSPIENYSPKFYLKVKNVF